MLQQTQAATVVPYYNRWLRRFPTVRSLAATTESDVLHAWQGLGYYTRARNLHRCGKMIVEKFGGRLPNDPDELKSLPGIGLYTANAIAVFAFDQSLPIVEANTARVLSRLFNIRAPIDSTSGRQKLWEASAKLVPQKGARHFQNTMMDLGALICTAHNPCCQICPVKKFCRADKPASLPRKRQRARTISITEWHCFRRRISAPSFAPRTIRAAKFVRSKSFVARISRLHFRENGNAHEPSPSPNGIASAQAGARFCSSAAASAGAGCGCCQKSSSETPRRFIARSFPSLTTASRWKFFAADRIG